MTRKPGTPRILAIATLASFGAIGTANATLSGDFIDFVTNDFVTSPNQHSLLNIEVLDAQLEFARVGGGAALDCLGATLPAICADVSVSFLDLSSTLITLGLGDAPSSATYNFFGINDIIASIALAFIGPSAFTANLVLSNNNILISDVHLIGGGAISGGDILMRLTFQEQPPRAPEPSTLLLLGAGLFGLWAGRRRN
jgi:hypothetical protein